MSQEIFEFIGKVIAIGGSAAAAAYGIFMFLGKKWIDNKFAERLEAFKHEQNKELQGLKYKIDTLFNRVTKIHDKEFEVLPEAWCKLQDALGLMSKITSLFQEYPQLNHMDKEELDEFLETTKLSHSQKNKLHKQDDKDQYYVEVNRWHELHEANKGLVEFHNYIIRNRIFLSAELKKKFSEIDDIMWDAYINKKVSEGAKDYKMSHEAYKKIKNDVDPIRDEIEQLMQKKLRFYEAD